MRQSLHNIPRLTAQIHPFVQKILSKKELLFELMHGIGSPLNIVFPQIFIENKARFEEVFKKHQIAGKVYYAHKTNQSSSLALQLATERNSYIDVASTNELRHALSCGFTGNRIGATGPKDFLFITLCIQHNVLISVDNEQELQEIASVAQSLNLKANITLRITDFHSENTTILSKTSRFGFSITKIQSLLTMVASFSQIELRGFAFHITTTTLKERVIAIESLLEIFDLALALGLNPTCINLGGGYKVNYLKTQAEWENFSTAIKEATLGKRDYFTWNEYSYGLWTESGRLRGNINLYKGYDELSSTSYLDAIFSHIATSSNQTIGEILRDRMIEVLIEPGRSLVDQCGITLGRVSYLKQSATGDNILGVQMNRADHSFLEYEVSHDPILLKQNQNSQPFSGYIAGNLCLESDFIFLRAIQFDETPETGDLLAFINSAGYFSDFSSHNAAKHPSAARVAITERENVLEWQLDDMYQPLLSKF